MAGTVSFIWTTVTDPHFTCKVKLTLTLPVFDTVTVTETTWPIVAESLGESTTEEMVGVDAEPEVNVALVE